MRLSVSLPLPAVKMIRVQLTQIVSAGSDGYINSGSLERDFLEQRAVQLGPHLLALILDVRLDVAPCGMRAPCVASPRPTVKIVT